MTGGIPSRTFMRTFEPVVDRLHADAQCHFGVPEVRLEPVGHEERPFSFLLRVAVWPRGAPQATGHLFIKVFKPKTPSAGVTLRGRVARDFETTRAIFDFLSQWNDVGAVRPVACFADLLAIVTEEVAGPTLLEHLEANAAWFPSAARIDDLEGTMRASALWLRRFHDFQAGNAAITIPSLLEYVDTRLRRLVDHAVITSDYRDRIVRHLAHLAGLVSPSDLREVAIHADLAPANMLVCGSRIVVLDFAMAARGSYLHDISRLFLQLDILRAKPQYRAHVVERLQSALLQGLDPDLTTGHPLFRYLLMLHRVNHLGTLALGRERFPASVLNARVRRLHRRWIDAELAASEGAS